jgi:L-ascorbate metabolism protein UlaG (beta-lactamase superfamily)
MKLSPRIAAKLHKLRQFSTLIRESAFHSITGEPQQHVPAPTGELGVTFIGHSSFLIQLGGRNILIDPVFSSRLIFLRRFRHPGLRIADLPKIDLVLLTHAHMDHLDRTSLRKIVRQQKRQYQRAPFAVVPVRVDDLVNDLGFSSVETTETWHTLRHSGIEITRTPARHWGARMFKDTDRGFGGYVLRSGPHSLYHSGDTAYFSGFREIGLRLSPEIALLPIGAYHPDSFRTVHTSPEDALQAFLDLGARTMIPMHYGTFRLSYEPMHEPVERLRNAAARAGVAARVRILGEGETTFFQPAIKRRAGLQANAG